MSSRLASSCEALAVEFPGGGGNVPDVRHRFTAGLRIDQGDFQQLRPPLLRRPAHLPAQLLVPGQILLRHSSDEFCTKALFKSRRRINYLIEAHEVVTKLPEYYDV